MKKEITPAQKDQSRWSRFIRLITVLYKKYCTKRYRYYAIDIYRKIPRSKEYLHESANTNLRFSIADNSWEIKRKRELKKPIAFSVPITSVVNETTTLIQEEWVPADDRQIGIIKNFLENPRKNRKIELFLEN